MLRTLSLVLFTEKVMMFTPGAMISTQLPALEKEASLSLLSDAPTPKAPVAPTGLLTQALKGKPAKPFPAAAMTLTPAATALSTAALIG